jgi:C-terminal processing protease CtpA/Prc
MRTVPALLITALCVALPRSALPQEPPRVDCEKDLKKTRDLVEDTWSFAIFRSNSVDLEREFKRLENRAKNTEDPGECADVIARFLATLGDGQARLRYYPEVRQTAPAIELRTLRERLSRTPGEQPTPHVYIVSRDTTDETLREILPGSELVAVDGEPIDAVRDYWMRRISGSTEQWRDFVCDERLLMGPPQQPVELQLRTPSRKLDTVLVARPAYVSASAPDERSTVAWSKTLDGGWGYLRMASFEYVDAATTVALFDEALAPLMEAPGLIIDVRETHAGTADAFLTSAGRFLGQEAVLGYVQERQPGQRRAAEFVDEETGETVSRIPLRAQPRDPVYAGPVVILIDRGCFSACEGFAGGLQSADRALLIGPEPSGGGSGWTAGWELPSEAIVSFSWTVMWLPSGEMVEDSGVKPDIAVRLRGRDFASGRDRVLRRAIEALEKGEAKSLMMAGGT